MESKRTCWYIRNQRSSSLAFRCEVKRYLSFHRLQVLPVAWNIGSGCTMGPHCSQVGKAVADSADDPDRTHGCS